MKDTDIVQAHEPAERTADSSHLVGVPEHKVAAGVGAVAGGAAAGAAAGLAGGPVGAVIGAAVGAVAGGLGGDAIASSVDQAKEGAYWREHYGQRPYVPAGAGYDDYGPAYDHALVAYQQHAGRGFDEVESELSRDWPSRRGASRLEWDDARHASRDAWERLHRR